MPNVGDKRMDWMKIRRTIAVLMVVSLNWVPLANAVDVLNKVDDLMGVAPNEKARKTGRHVILNFLAECEFSEPCILGLIYRLNEYNKKEPNPMFKEYVSFLDAQKQEIAKSALACRTPAKQVVRKAYAECIKERLANEDKIDILSREKIDKMRDEQDVCVKKKMTPIAKEGNIYAQAILVNLDEQSRDIKDMNFWYEEMTKKQGTEEFNTYLKCTDIP